MLPLNFIKGKIITFRGNVTSIDIRIAIIIYKDRYFLCSKNKVYKINKTY